MLAILAGNGGAGEKEAIARRIIFKLQELYASDENGLRVKIKQLEMLSLLRGETIQQLIIQEEQKMPVTIDITKDLRFKQGIEVGIEKDKKEIAENLLKEGLAVLFVQKVTGLPLATIETMAKSLKKG